MASEWAAGADPSSEEGRARRLIESIAQGFFVQQADGRLTEVNTAALDLFGLSREEFLGRDSLAPAWDVVREDGSPLPGEQHPSMVALRTGAPVRGQVAGVRHARTGRRVWFEISALPEFDPGATRASRVLVTLHDVTARRNAEAHYRDVVRTSMDGYWHVDATGRLVDANEAACRMTGYRREELLGMHLADLEASESPAEFAAHLERLRATGEDHFETRHRGKDGRILDVEVEVLARPEGGGFIAFVRDITARKRAEAIDRSRFRLLELAATSSLHELLVATLDEAEQLTGSRVGFFHFLLADQRTIHLQAWSTRTARDYCRAEGAGAHYDVTAAGVWADCIRNRGPVVVNDYPGHPDKRGMPPGHAELVRMLGVPVMRGSRIVAMLGVGNKERDYDPADVRCVERLADLAWDLAERKRAEEEQARLERRMGQAQRLESLGVLAGGVAHDFNNILTGVMGHAGLLRDALPGDSPLRLHAGEIVHASARAAELCSQMLAYAGQGSTRRAPNDLREVVERTLALVRASLASRVRLDVELPPGPAVVVCDAAQLRQVLMNLVLNASESIDGRGGTITLRLAPVELGPEAARALAPPALEPGPYVEMTVADDGCGMDRETLERIFDPFFSTKFTGRGLGLSAVRGILHAHQGAIVATSAPGVGTVMRVLLPRADVAPVPAEPPRDRASEDWRGSGAVLVVAGERGLREPCAHVLRDLGLEPVMAADGPEALARFAERRGEVRLVLLDLANPGRDGHETLAGLRALDPGVRVVLATGYGQDPPAGGPGDGPVAGVLQKPFEPEDLRSLVIAALARRG